MKIAMGVRRRDAGMSLTPGDSQQDYVDHNACVLTTRTWQGAFLDLAVVPSDNKPHVVGSALENAVLPDDGVGVHWVVVDNASPALHAALSWSFPSLRGVALDTCHLQIKFEAVASHHLSAGSGCSVSKVNVSFPSEVCPDVDADETFRGEHTDAAVTSMKRAEVWSGLAEWIRALAAVATLFSRRWRCTQSSEVFSGIRITCRCPRSG